MLSKIEACQEVETVTKEQQKKVKGGGIIIADDIMT